MLLMSLLTSFFFGVRVVLILLLWCACVCGCGFSYSFFGVQRRPRKSTDPPKTHPLYQSRPSLSRVVGSRSFMIIPKTPNL